jgi:tetratricopeptide (TPR) repeat protein
VSVVADPQQLRARADAVLELHELGDVDAALTACDGLIEDAASAASADPADPVVRETLFAARFERALLLTELGELSAAADAYEAAAATQADLDDPDQRHEVAMALLNRGICLDAIGDHRAALGAYDDLVGTFADADDPVTRDQVIRGRVNRASALLAVDEVHEALTVADSLIGELDPSEALEAEQLAMTVRLRAAALRALDRRDEAAASLADVERCSDEDPAARSQVAAAQRERAEVLAELGRSDEAIAILEAAVARFTDDPDPVVVEVLIDLLRAEADLLERSGDPQRAAEIRARAGA